MFDSKMMVTPVGACYAELGLTPLVLIRPRPFCIRMRTAAHLLGRSKQTAASVPNLFAVVYSDI
jgi:hypothetical protein